MISRPIYHRKHGDEPCGQFASNTQVSKPLGLFAERLLVITGGHARARRRADVLLTCTLPPLLKIKSFKNLFLFFLLYEKLGVTFGRGEIGLVLEYGA
jgi:hypothetical protein